MRFVGDLLGRARHSGSSSDARLNVPQMPKLEAEAVKLLSLLLTNLSVHGEESASAKDLQKPIAWYDSERLWSLRLSRSVTWQDGLIVPLKPEEERMFLAWSDGGPTQLRIAIQGTGRVDEALCREVYQMGDLERGREIHVPPADVQAIVERSIGILEPIVRQSRRERRL